MLEPPRQGGSNEYPQSMFWSKNKKNRYTPANPSLTYIKVGFKGVNITRTCFRDESVSFLMHFRQAKTTTPTHDHNTKVYQYLFTSWTCHNIFVHVFAHNWTCIFKNMVIYHVYHNHGFPLQVHRQFINAMCPCFQ